MSDATPESLDPYGPYIEKLAKLGVSVAQELHDRTIAAETADDAANLAKAFHQVTRGVRQTLALHARLLREQRAEEREQAADFAAQARRRDDDRQAASRRRRREIRDAVNALIWTEYEKPEDCDFLCGELERQLDWACGQDDFLARPIDEAILQVRERLPIRKDGSIEPEAMAEFLSEYGDDYDLDDDETAADVRPPVRADGGAPASADTS